MLIHGIPDCDRGAYIFYVLQVEKKSKIKAPPFLPPNYFEENG